MTGPYGQPGGSAQWGRPPQGPPAGFPGGQPPRSGGGGPQPGVAQAGYAQPVPPRSAAVPRRRKNRLPWVFGALVLLVVAGAVAFAGFVQPGLLVRTEFDAASVQKGVEQTLRSSYHLGAVESVRCPSGQLAEPGRQFECQVAVGGARKSVQVTVRDDSGVYEVGYPR